MFASSFPNGVKWLILSNIGVYLIYFFGSLLNGAPIFEGLVLMPSSVVHGAVWQLVTYLFLHSLTSFWHILFNMLTLWMFGKPIEETWGTRRFLQYYFLCGIGAGICVVLANTAFGDPYQRVIGASGAIYGLLLAYGMLFPDQTVMFSFLFPIKAKYMVMIFGGIAFLSSFQGPSTVSNLAHLGGMLFGFGYMRTQFAGRSRRVQGRAGFSLNLGGRWRDYKLQRAKRKFQVYMKNEDSRRGPWVN